MVITGTTTAAVRLLFPAVRRPFYKLICAAMNTVPLALYHAGGSTVSGLAVVIPLWLEHSPDMSGSLLTRQNAAALLQLLQLRHQPGLSSLMVQGQPIEAPASSGRVTRSKAKQQGGLQYSQVSERQLRLK